MSTISVSAPAHTAGPWSFFATRNYCLNRAFVITSDTVDIIAVTPGWDPDHHRPLEEANCRLMAAAPDLLDCLKELHRRIRTKEGMSDVEDRAVAALIDRIEGR